MGVLIGYDRPLDYVHMTISRVVPGEAEDEIVYSNLDDVGAGLDCQDVNYFRQVLAGLGISVPESMFKETLRDQQSRAGNRCMDHTPEGTVGTLRRKHTSIVPAARGA